MTGPTSTSPLVCHHCGRSVVVDFGSGFTEWCSGHGTVCRRCSVEAGGYWSNHETCPDCSEPLTSIAPHPAPATSDCACGARLSMVPRLADGARVDEEARAAVLAVVAPCRCPPPRGSVAVRVVAMALGLPLAAIAAAWESRPRDGHSAPSRVQATCGCGAVLSMLPRAHDPRRPAGDVADAMREAREGCRCAPPFSDGAVDVVAAALALPPARVKELWEEYLEFLNGR